MKVMLRENKLGHLVVYVAKKDLEEEVVKQVDNGENGFIYTLANGWELEVPAWQEGTRLPFTIEAKRLA
ncbi:MAG TPA: putative nitrogen fixation protein NifT [Synechococcales cyanobacterium M55_K2018_004]|nr:putative nitrogen fixation protein NifT [Synechococcales cyanobacterium M55_K2018_004]